MSERVQIGYHILGMYRRRKDWQSALQKRFRTWDSGEEVKLTEMNLVLILQIANQWSDADMVAQAGVDGAKFAQLKADLDQLRSELLELIYLPQTVQHLQVEGFTTGLDTEKLSQIVATVPISRTGQRTICLAWRDVCGEKWETKHNDISGKKRYWVNK